MHDGTRPATFQNRSPPARGQTGAVAASETDDWLTIRHAKPEDLGALARLHVVVWRDTYRLLAPESAYLALDESTRRKHWEVLLRRDPAHWQTLVAEHDGNLAGFSHSGPGKHDVLAGAGEVVHLYVDPSLQGRGIGRTLLRASIAFLRASGFSAVKLAVVRGNDRAIRFYEREGGRVVAHFVDGVLWRSDNAVVEFTSEGATR